VLDCTVGIGTQAIGLAAAGYRVRGTDLSPGAIRRAGREARRAGVDLPLQVADIRALRSVVHETFDAVVTFDNSLAHLIEDSDLDRAATEMAVLTRPGGVVAAGIRDYDALVVDRPSTTPLRTHDTSEERRASFQLWDWAEDGRTYRLEQVVLRGHGGAWTGTGRVSRLRALRRAELSRSLVGAGLEEVRWHLPPDSGYYQPVVTARRPTADAGEGDTGPRR
jgi:SAM-dependent methyltransferase